jgi:hypothetical protein
METAATAAGGGIPGIPPGPPAAAEPPGINFEKDYSARLLKAFKDLLAAAATLATAAKNQGYDAWINPLILPMPLHWKPSLRLRRTVPNNLVHEFGAKLEDFSITSDEIYHVLVKPAVFLYNLRSL